MTTYDYILNTVEKKGAVYLVLLDPDKLAQEKATDFLKHCEKAGRLISETSCTGNLKSLRIKMVRVLSGFIPPMPGVLIPFR